MSDGREATRQAGSLTVVGTGLRPGLQTTPEARAQITIANRVFYMVGESLAEGLVQDLAPEAEPLQRFYQEGRPRTECHAAMVEHVLAAVRRGDDVCLVFYGHPGVFVRPGHQAVRRARAEGFRAVMLPGISAEDCLFADLGVDPAADGCQSFEATSFLHRGYRFDPRCPLVLWQVGITGELTFTSEYGAPELPALVERLCESYPRHHEVLAYEATTLPLPGATARIERVALEDLASAQLSPRTTLYVPPLAE